MILTNVIRIGLIATAFLNIFVTSTNVNAANIKFEPCKAGYSSKGACVLQNDDYKATVGESCATGSDCIDKNTACSDSDVDGIDPIELVCIDCGAGLPNIARDKCVEYATEIGGSCSDEPINQCYRVEGSQCTTAGKCDCLPGYVGNVDNNKCLPKGSDGALCTSGAECTYPDSVCTIDEDDEKAACTPCTADDFANNDKDKCLSYATTIGESCSEQAEQCGRIGHSECFEAKTCECLFGFVPNEDRTECFSPVGACLSGADCLEVHTACFDDNVDGVKTCNACGLNQFPSKDKDKCLEYATEIGGSCEQTEQCQMVSDTVCASGKCECFPGYVSNADKTRCLPAGSEDATCETGNECTEINSVCTSTADSEGITICKPCSAEEFANNEKNECLLYATEVGGSCTGQPEQCNNLENSQCTQGICECKQDFEPDAENIKCTPKCEKGSDCPDSNSVCFDLDGDGAGTCILCDATTNEFPNEGKDKCILYASELGGSCSIQPQNQCSLLINSECQDGYCKCPSGYVESESNLICLKAALVGEKCEETTQCAHLGDTSYCADSTGSGEKLCVCPSDTSYATTDRTKCYKFATEVGESCQETRQCSLLNEEYAECLPSTGKCSCINDAIPSSDNKECLSTDIEFEGECKEHAQCKNFNNSFCLLDSSDDKTKCRCNDTFVYYQEGLECLEVIDTLDKECFQDIQCNTNTTKSMGERSECNERTHRCQCTEEAGYLTSQKKCYKKANYNEVCDLGLDEQCIVGVNEFAECRISTVTLSPTCQCKSEAITHENNCYGRKHLGDNCIFDKECSVPILGESTCDPIKHICTCKIDYVEDFSKTACRSGAFSIQRIALVNFIVIMVGRITSLKITI